MGKYNDLTGPVPNLAPSVGTYQNLLHVPGFKHITVNAFNGSQATCMGYSYASGPYIDDQFLLTQTCSAPVGP